MAVTKAGRVLVVHGLHLEGVQLKWRDPGEPWRKKTTGTVARGALLQNSGTGDWTASIATARDGKGKEHAWVVWSGWSATGAREAQMRRLSRLNSRNGPKVGPVVTLAPEGTAGVTGNAKIDIAFEKAPSGGRRGVVTWQRRTGASSWEIVTTWFTKLGTNEPSFHHLSSLFSGSSFSTVSTLAPSPTGMDVVVRTADGHLGLFRHDADDALTSWTAAPVGVAIGSDAKPSAVTLKNGDTLAVGESGGVVTIQRWSPSDPLDQQILGYRDPAITSNGTVAWIVMVRDSDDKVVARKLTGEILGSDRVVVGGAGGNHEWPSVPSATSTHLRVLVRGPAYDDNQTSVLFGQRRV